MKIAVCIKQVPSSNKVEVDPTTGVLKRDGADAKLNPYDLFALETALVLKEKCGGEITVISMGPPQAQAIIREAFSMGADHGILLSDRAFAGADVLATSYALAKGIETSGPYDMIICGKQTTDGDTAQVGSEMAEQLSLPSISNVTSVEPIADGTIRVTMDMGESVLTASVRLPALISVDKDICVPRLPSYLMKKATLDREITVLSFAELKNGDKSRCGLGGSPTQVARIFPPEKNTAREMWNGTSDALAERAVNQLVEDKFL